VPRSTPVCLSAESLFMSVVWRASTGTVDWCRKPSSLGLMSPFSRFLNHFPRPSRGISHRQPVVLFDPDARSK
jgi:hypothetical protein